MRSGAWLFAVLTITACNAVLGIEEPTRVNSLGGSGTGNNNTAGNGSGSNGNSDERQACVLNSNCLETELCVFRVCSPPCQEDRDCFSDERCLQLDGATACVASDNATCTTESQCPEGSTCSEGQCRNPCVAVDAGEVILAASDAAGSLSCLADQQCVEGVCRGTDTGHDPVGDGGVVPAADGSTSSGSDGGEPGCTPQDVRCNDSVLETCSAARTWGDPQPCVYGCRAKACSECIPTERECFDGDARSCDEDGRWGQVTPCPLLCELGECVDRCTESTKQCDDDVPQTCVDGAWDNGTACEFGCHGQGVCDECEAGTTRCTNGNEQEQLCEADGQWGELTSCGSLGCLAGRCAECNPTASRCVNTNHAVQECNDDGRWDDPEGCTYDCSNDVCNECSVGSAVCDNSTQLRTCPSGTSMVNDCIDTTCVVDQCVGECAPGDEQCSNNRVQECGADGYFANAAGNCTTSDMTCVEAGGAATCEGICAPTQTDCYDSDTLSECDSTGQFAMGDDCDVPTPVCLDGSCVVCDPNPTPTQCTSACSRTPQYCSAQGDWANATNCTSGNVCQNGSCVPAADTSYGESTQLGGSGSQAGDYLIAIKVNIPCRSTLLKLGNWTNGAGGTMRLGIYTDVSNAPGTKIAATTDITINAAGAFESATSPPGQILNAGDYWIAANFSATTPIRRDSGLGSARYVTFDYSDNLTLPTTFPAPLSNSNKYNHYMVVQPNPL